MESDRGAFDSIPVELRELITTFLDARSKRIFRLANKEWFNIIRYDNYTIYFATNSNLHDIIAHLSSNPNLISLSFRKNKLRMPAKEFVSAISVLTNLKKLAFNDNFDEETLAFEDWIKLSNLTNIQDWDFLFWRNVPVELIAKFSDIRKLVFSASATELAPTLKATPNLECLKIIHQGDFSIDPFTQLQYPSKLTELHIRVQQAFQLFSVDTSIEKLKQLCNLKVLTFEDYSKDNLNMYLDQFTSLESIYLYSPESQPLHTNTNLTNLQLRCSKIHLEHLMQFTQLKKLRILATHWPQNATYRRFDFLTAMTDLQQFTIYDYTPHNIRDKSEDRLLVNFLSTNLTSLHGDFEVQCLIKFEKLESLELRGVTDDLDYLRYLTNLTALVIYSAHNISTVNILTKLKKLNLQGKKIPRDYKQLNLDELTNLESLSIPSLSPLASTVNNLSKLTKLTALHLSINFDDEDFKYDFDNLKLTSFTNVGTNNNEKLIESLAKITTLGRLSFNDWRSEENILLFTELSHLTFLRVLPATGAIFSGRHLSALTSLQMLRGLGPNMKECAKLIDTMPYLLNYA